MYFPKHRTSSPPPPPPQTTHVRIVIVIVIECAPTNNQSTKSKRHRTHTSHIYPTHAPTAKHICAIRVHSHQHQHQQQNSNHNNHHQHHYQQQQQENNVKSAMYALSSTSSSFGTAAASGRFDAHGNGIDDAVRAQALAEEEAAMNQYRVGVRMRPTETHPKAHV